MASTIFSGNTIKTLKAALQLNAEATIYSGSVDPSSSATTGTPGSLYLNSTTGNIYQKLDTGSSTNWILWNQKDSPNKNYLAANSSAEVNTTGWATYADAAGVGPVDGTGGSPSATFTRVTNTPLRGSSSFQLTKGTLTNRQGDGASYAFTIDSADQAKVLAITCDYNAPQHAAQTFTVTLASPAVFTSAAAHNFIIGEPVSFTTTGALPTGLAASTVYYISAVPSSTTYRVSATLGGADVNSSVSQSGTHTQVASGMVAANGTTAPNANSTGDSDVEFFIYDVTNSVVIPVSPQVLTANGLGNYTFKGVFQTASNSTSYRLILHIGTGSLLSWCVRFDNFCVGPQSVAYGSAITDWTAYTPTFTGFGTVTSNAAYYRRVGGNVEVVAWGISGTVPATTLGKMTWPTGLVADPTYARVGSGGSTAMQVGRLTVDSTADNSIAVLDTSLSTTSVGFSSTSDANGGQFRNSTDYLGNTQNYTIRYTFPVLGWSSTTLMSNDTDTRVVGCRANGNPASAASGNPIIFPTITYDTHGGYSTSTGRYTVPVSGFYQLHGFLRDTGTAGTTHSMYKNAVSIDLCGRTGATYQSTNLTGIVNCSAGDILDVRSDDGSASDASAGYISWTRISGPATIAASNIVACRTTGNAPSATSGNPFIWPSVDWDTHGGYNTTTGKYTVPISGFYEVEAYFNTTSGASISFTPYINGVADKVIGFIQSSSIGAGSGTVKCVAGDLLDLRPQGTVDPSAADWMTIKRVGGTG